MANPIFIPAPFAVNGIKNPIQKTRQSGQDPQDATWLTGWEGITFTPIKAGGKPPKGQDFNGIFYALSANAVHVQNGGRYKFSQDVITNYGGYAKDAIVQSDDGTKEFISLVDSNTVNPNNGLANAWSIYAGSGSVPAATSTTAGVTRVINSLDSTDIAAALTAAQGKILQDKKLEATDLKDASTTQKGIVQLNDTLTSTSTTQALTAAQGKVLNDKFNFQNSKNQSGYVRLGDSGLIIQWGTVDYDSPPGEVDVVTAFPLPFPSACLNVQLTRKAGGSSTTTQNDGGALLVSASRFNFTANMAYFSQAGAAVRGFTWFAIGY